MGQIQGQVKDRYYKVFEMYRRMNQEIENKK
jgi:hypothetical protein